MMTSHRMLALAIAIAIPAAGSAQHSGSEPTSARPALESSQFDFLIGQWDITVTPQASTLAARMHGVTKLNGTWKAWRALEGRGLEDELRIVDASGNARSLTHFVRVYDGTAKTWRISTVDAYRANLSQSTAASASGGMEVTATAPVVDSEGKAYVARSRFTDVTTAAFKYVQERSYDGGKKWEVVQRIEGIRAAASAPR